VVGRLRHLDHAADVGDGLALGNQLLCRSLLRRSLRLELADDLLGCVPGAFHGRVPGLVWPAEDSHSPWTEFQGPRHHHPTPATGPAARMGEDAAASHRWIHKACQKKMAAA
jgi:hypothetical protein